jgi:hypothetical protein
MRQRRETLEHPFGTIKARMGATHFLMKTLPRDAAQRALQVLAYNLTRMGSHFSGFSFRLEGLLRQIPGALGGPAAAGGPSECDRRSSRRGASSLWYSFHMTSIRWQ